MKFLIHTNTIEGHKSASGKALYLTHTYGGFNTGESVEWFALSQMNVGAANECGWCEVIIPDWMLKQKGYIGYGNTLKGAFKEADEA